MFAVKYFPWYENLQKQAKLAFILAPLTTRFYCYLSIVTSFKRLKITVQKRRFFASEKYLWLKNSK